MAAKAMQNPFEKKEDDKPEAPEEKGTRHDDVEVKLDDDEDEEGDGEEDAAAAGKRSWQEKKRNRYAERVREAEDARREAEQVRQELAQVRQNQAQLAQAIQPQQYDGPQQRLQQLREMARAKAQEFNSLVQKNALTPELEKRYWDEHEQIQDGVSRLQYEIHQAQDPRNDPAFQHNQDIIRWLQNSHNDVMNHPRRDEIILAARGKLYHMVGLGKARMGDFASYEKALAETKQDFGIGRRQATSSNGMQAKLVGVPRGGGSNEPTRTMRLTREEQKMAEARYRNIGKTPEEMHRMWAKDIQKQREKKARSGT